MSASRHFSDMPRRVMSVGGGKADLMGAVFAPLVAFAR